MKLSRLKRLIILAFAYFAIICNLFLFWEEITSGDIMLEFLLSPLLITFFAIYIILYKKRWIIAPAKIIFFSLFLINLILSFQYFYDYIDLILFLPSLLPLILLYKNNLKNWFIFLKSKPFYILKRKQKFLKKILF